MENSYGNFIVQKLLYQTEGIHKIILLSEVKRLVPMLHKMNVQRKWISIIDEHEKVQPGSSSRLFTNKNDDECKSKFYNNTSDLNNSVYQQKLADIHSANVSLDNSFGINSKPQQSFLRNPNLIMTNNQIYYPSPIHNQGNANFASYLYPSTIVPLQYQPNYVPIYQLNPSFNQTQPNQKGQFKQKHIFIPKK